MKDKETIKEEKNKGQEMERLDKILVSQNVGSRKEVQKLIKEGLVTVDGKICKKPETKLEPESSEILVNGTPLSFQRHVYIMMNKPAGVLSASNDKRAETVIDLLPEEMKRRGLFPAGRLDKDTTGLIIITDDGDFAHNMLAPKKHVYKLYRAETDGEITESHIESFREGIVFEDGTECLPAELYRTCPLEEPYRDFFGGDENPCAGFVRICEGKFHQVKKMFAAVGLHVVSLKRLSVGGLVLDIDLNCGEARYLSNCEKNLIFNTKKS